MQFVTMEMAGERTNALPFAVWVYGAVVGL